VRIAHLDTGYDPSHGTVPENTSKTQRNFVDAAFPEDATDRTTSGILTNVGHGTGTLSILAGKAIAGSNPVPAVGIATRAGVVPIRVANSVVLFENSAIAVPAQMAQ
jgi:hypothetical protein